MAAMCDTQQNQQSNDDSHISSLSYDEIDSAPQMINERGIDLYTEFIKTPLFDKDSLYQRLEELGCITKCNPPNVDIRILACPAFLGSFNLFVRESRGLIHFVSNDCKKEDFKVQLEHLKKYGSMVHPGTFHYKIEINKKKGTLMLINNGLLIKSEGQERKLKYVGGKELVNNVFKTLVSATAPDHLYIQDESVVTCSEKNGNQVSDDASSFSWRLIIAIKKPMDKEVLKEHYEKIKNFQEEKETVEQLYDVAWYQALGIRIPDRDYVELIRARLILSKYDGPEQGTSILQYLHDVYGKVKVEGKVVANCQDLYNAIRKVRYHNDEIKWAIQRLEQGIDINFDKTVQPQAMTSPYNSMLSEHDHYWEIDYNKLGHVNHGYFDNDYIQQSNDIFFYNEMTVLLLTIFIGIGFICICVSIICIICVGLIWKSQKKRESIVDDPISNCL